MLKCRTALALRTLCAGTHLMQVSVGKQFLERKKNKKNLSSKYQREVYLSVLVLDIQIDCAMGRPADDQKHRLPDKRCTLMSGEHALVTEMFAVLSFPISNHTLVLSLREESNPDVYTVIRASSLFFFFFSEKQAHSGAT